VSLVNVSVCWLPRPDQDPTVFQTTTSFDVVAGGGEFERHPAKRSTNARA
jgi:hypothetical protein